ncbi:MULTISPECIES: nitroreductase [unclassified Chelatococcus]|uniref:nitroreductase family protein n=1 Tax=unclassified Chelatococcus TaxID=2638111 RepID=UPI001BCAA5CC|nr:MULTISPECIES: nitroreductase [unclassified Chelatococcus]MBS7698129.1 nitroreductase [Chelatococcus sp. YT9]MBX3556553.1 nitroreductase [Chelatococcus sp.]
MLELLQTRRSVPPRLLHAPGPSPEELSLLLRIASRVPDHGKLAPWRFIVFQGDARKAAGELIAGVYAADNPEADDKRLAAERDRLAFAPLVIGIVSRAGAHVKIPEWEQVLSAGAVAMNLTIAANAMGYGSAWLTEWYAYDRRVLEKLGVAANERMAGFVHIGTPVERQPDRPRPDLADVVTHFGS